MQIIERLLIEERENRIITALQIKQIVLSKEMEQSRKKNSNLIIF